jgi:hypothetical protein
MYDFLFFLKMVTKQRIRRAIDPVPHRIGTQKREQHLLKTSRKRSEQEWEYKPSWDSCLAAEMRHEKCDTDTSGTTVSQQTLVDDYAELTPEQREKADREEAERQAAWRAQQSGESGAAVAEAAAPAGSQTQTTTNATESDLQAAKATTDSSSPAEENATTPASAGKSADNPSDLATLPENLRRTITRIREGKKVNISKALCDVVQKQPQLFTERIREQYYQECDEAGYYNAFRGHSKTPAEANGAKPNKSNDEANYTTPSGPSDREFTATSQMEHGTSSSSSSEFPLAIVSIGAVGGLAGLVYGSNTGLDSSYMVALAGLTIYCAWTVWTRIQTSKSD